MVRIMEVLLPVRIVELRYLLVRMNEAYCSSDNKGQSLVRIIRVHSYNKGSDIRGPTLVRTIKVQLPVRLEKV